MLARGAWITFHPSKPPAPLSSVGAAMITDITPYRKYVDHFDLTEEQKLDLVNAVWMLVENIYDYHLGINKLFLFDKTHQKSVDCEVAPVTIDTAPLNHEKEDGD